MKWKFCSLIFIQQIFFSTASLESITVSPAILAGEGNSTREGRGLLDTITGFIKTAQTVNQIFAGNSQPALPSSGAAGLGGYQQNYPSQNNNNYGQSTPGSSNFYNNYYQNAQQVQAPAQQYQQIPAEVPGPPYPESNYNSVYNPVSSASSIHKQGQVPSSGGSGALGQLLGGGTVGLGQLLNGGNLNALGQLLGGGNLANFAQLLGGSGQQGAGQGGSAGQLGGLLSQLVGSSGQNGGSSGQFNGLAGGSQGQLGQFGQQGQLGQFGQQGQLGQFGPQGQLGQFGPQGQLGQFGQQGQLSQQGQFGQLGQLGGSPGQTLGSSGQFGGLGGQIGANQGQGGGANIGQLLGAGANSLLPASLNELGIFDDLGDLFSLQNMEKLLKNVNQFDSLKCIPRMVCQTIARRQEETEKLEREQEEFKRTSTTTTTRRPKTKNNKRKDESTRDGRFLPGFKVQGVDTALEQFVKFLDLMQLKDWSLYPYLQGAYQGNQVKSWNECAQKFSTCPFSEEQLLYYFNNYKGGLFQSFRSDKD